MQKIKNLFNEKKYKLPKKTIVELVFELLEKNGIKLNGEENKTFSFYLEKCKKSNKEKEAYEIVSTILKDKNEKTKNVRGRIVSELKKICAIDEKSIISIEDNIYTSIRVRYIPVFSTSNRREEGVRDEDGRWIIRKFNLPNGSITQYHRDLTYFDEKVLYALCTLCRQQKNKKVTFTLRQICKMLHISSGTKNIARIVDSIESLNEARFKISRFLFEEGVSEQRNFNFIDGNYRIITSEEKSRTAKSYIVLNEIIFNHINDSTYVKKMDKKYFELKNGYEFKIFSYLNVLNKSKIILKRNTLLIHGLSIEQKNIDDSKKIKVILKKINKALKNLKEKGYIKDFEIEGRGINRKYTFKL